jgi:cutinase
VCARLVARFLAAQGAVVAITWSVLGVFVPSASAEPCPDVEAVFARGTTEAPGVGAIGQAFVDSLQSKVGSKSFGVYPVDYPASTDFHTALDGIKDAGNHVESMAANCPKTKMVLGGYSQGAAVMGFVTSAAIPDGVDPADVPKPMPADVANHVAAVTLFGAPSNRFMDTVGAPQVVIGPLYQPKTLELCATDDPVCSDGGDWAAHGSYADDGMVDQGASYAASHL